MAKKYYSASLGNNGIVDLIEERNAYERLSQDSNAAKKYFDEQDRLRKEEEERKRKEEEEIKRMQDEIDRQNREIEETERQDKERQDRIKQKNLTNALATVSAQETAEKKKAEQKKEKLVNETSFLDKLLSTVVGGITLAAEEEYNTAKQGVKDRALGLLEGYTGQMYYTNPAERAARAKLTPEEQIEYDAKKRAQKQNKSDSYSIAEMIGSGARTATNMAQSMVPGIARLISGGDPIRSKVEDNLRNKIIQYNLEGNQAEADKIQKKLDALGNGRWDALKDMFYGAGKQISDWQDEYGLISDEVRAGELELFAEHDKENQAKIDMIQGEMTDVSKQFSSQDQQFQNEFRAAKETDGIWDDVQASTKDLGAKIRDGRVFDSVAGAWDNTVTKEFDKMAENRQQLVNTYRKSAGIEDRTLMGNSMEAGDYDTSVQNLKTADGKTITAPVNRINPEKKAEAEKRGEKIEADYYNTQQIKKDENGYVVTDGEGNPVYEDKYTGMSRIWNALDAGAFLSKNWWETAGSDTVGSLVGFALPGTALNKGIGAAGNILRTGGNAARTGQQIASRVGVNTVTEAIAAEGATAVARAGQDLSRAARAQNKAVDIGEFLAQNQIMASAEAGANANGTRKEVLDAEVDRLGDLNSQEKTEARKQKALALGYKEGDVNYENAMRRFLDEERSYIMANNEDIAIAATAKSNLAGELAYNANMVQSLISLNETSMFFANKIPKLKGMYAPLTKIGKTAADQIIEPFTEGLEESIGDWSGKFAKEAVLKGKYSGLSDYVFNDMLGEKEGLETFMIGALTGAGQSAVMGGVNLGGSQAAETVQNVKDFRDNLKIWKDLKNSENTGERNVVVNFLNTLEGTDKLAKQTELSDQIAEHIKNGDTRTAYSKSLISFTNHAAEMHSRGLGGMMDSHIAKLEANPNLSEDQRETLAKMKTINKEAGEIIDGHAELPHANTLTENRLSRLANRERLELESNLQKEAVKEAEKAIEIEAERLADEDGKKDLTDEEKELYKTRAKESLGNDHLSLQVLDNIERNKKALEERGKKFDQQYNNLLTSSYIDAMRNEEQKKMVSAVRKIKDEQELKDYVQSLADKKIKPGNELKKAISETRQKLVAKKKTVKKKEKETEQIVSPDPAPVTPETPAVVPPPPVDENTTEIPPTEESNGDTSKSQEGIVSPPVSETNEQDTKRTILEFNGERYYTQGDTMFSEDTGRPVEEDTRDMILDQGKTIETLSAREHEDRMSYDREEANRAAVEEFGVDPAEIEAKKANEGPGTDVQGKVRESVQDETLNAVLGGEEIQIQEPTQEDNSVVQSSNDEVVVLSEEELKKAEELSEKSVKAVQEAQKNSEKNNNMSKADKNKAADEILNAEKKVSEVKEKVKEETSPKNTAGTKVITNPEDLFNKTAKVSAAQEALNKTFSRFKEVFFKSNNKPASFEDVISLLLSRAPKDVVKKSFVAYKNTWLALAEDRDAAQQEVLEVYEKYFEMDDLLNSILNEGEILAKASMSEDMDTEKKTEVVSPTPVIKTENTEPAETLDKESATQITEEQVTEQQKSLAPPEKEVSQETEEVAVGNLIQVPENSMEGEEVRLSFKSTEDYYIDEDGNKRNKENNQIVLDRSRNTDVDNILNPVLHMEGQKVEIRVFNPTTDLYTTDAEGNQEKFPGTWSNVLFEEYSEEGTRVSEVKTFQDFIDRHFGGNSDSDKEARRLMAEGKPLPESHPKYALWRDNVPLMVSSEYQDSLHRLGTAIPPVNWPASKTNTQGLSSEDFKNKIKKEQESYRNLRKLALEGKHPADGFKIKRSGKGVKRFVTIEKNVSSIALSRLQTAKPIVCLMTWAEDRNGGTDLRFNIEGSEENFITKNSNDKERVEIDPDSIAVAKEEMMKKRGSKGSGLQVKLNYSRAYVDKTSGKTVKVYELVFTVNDAETTDISSVKDDFKDIFRYFGVVSYLNRGGNIEELHPQAKQTYEEIKGKHSPEKLKELARTLSKDYKISLDSINLVTSADGKFVFGENDSVKNFLDAYPDKGKGTVLSKKAYRNGKFPIIDMENLSLNEYTSPFSGRTGYMAFVEDTTQSAVLQATIQDRTTGGEIAVTDVYPDIYIVPVGLAESESSSRKREVIKNETEDIVKQLAGKNPSSPANVVKEVAKTVGKPEKELSEYTKEELEDLIEAFNQYVSNKYIEGFSSSLEMKPFQQKTFAQRKVLLEALAKFETHKENKTETTKITPAKEKEIVKKAVEKAVESGVEPEKIVPKVEVPNPTIKINENLKRNIEDIDFDAEIEAIIAEETKETNEDNKDCSI